MRVLWLSPWLRPLARVYGEQLRAQGDDVLLVTSDQHPQEVVPLDWEIVTDPRPKTVRTWPDFASVYRRARDFRPDVVITELVRDPRWIALGALAPRIQFIHDDQPHGADEARPRWERALFDRWGSGAARTVCFSEYVASRIRAHTPGQVSVVPLTSDVADSAVGGVCPADQRRDFVLIGRLNEYKNLPVIFEAWEWHVRGADYRGDRLCLYGSSARPPLLPEVTWWNGGSFDYDEVLAPLRAAKGSLAHYRVATQSGVQVLAMQHGVAPIVSTNGALPEFQPVEPAPIDVDDVEGLAQTFDLLADPDSAAALGADAAATYRHRFAADVAARRLREVLAETLALADNQLRVQEV